MYIDDFKGRYTTVPIAIYRAYFNTGTTEVISHRHREIELIAITEGEAEVYIDSERYHARKGDVIVIAPHFIHRLSTSADSLTSYYCICFDPSLLSDTSLAEGLESNTMGLYGHICGDTNIGAVAIGNIERAFLAVENGYDGWELEAVGEISLLFSRIKREGYVTKSAPARNKEREFGRTAMAYISEHFEENITSSTLADAMFMNVSYFCRVFKQTFGCCFSEYLMEYRLQAAAAKLRDSDLSVSDIAFGVGFNGSSYFTKSFKERFGETPCKYRKRNISNISP